MVIHTTSLWQSSRAKTLRFSELTRWETSTSDGKDVTFTYGEYHQAAESTTTDTVEVEESQQKDTTVSTYVLNTNSMKFHKPDCSAVAQMSDANRKDYTGSRDDLIEQGYTPCGYCKP